MRKPLGITMFICALSLHGSGCVVAPCPVVSEPGCDTTDPNHECRNVCADEVRVDDPGEGEEAQEPDAPTNEEGQAEGHPSGENVDATSG